MKTFLVLPEAGNSKSPDDNLFTKTWCLKKQKEIKRPRTATLSEPTILNPKLIKTIDMSLVTKELLTIDLCKHSAPKSEKNSPRHSLNDKNNNNIHSKFRISPINSNVSKLFPQPCTTCGRPDLPERFHSHPSTPAAKPKKPIEIKIKNTVQKPMAIKFKSKCKIPNIIKQVSEEEKQDIPEKSPKTLICYICGREFGTASLSLHEPKCLEKWRLENSQLPPNLQKSTPIKPTSFSTKLEWNSLAWKSFQTNLVPCEKCGRTFYPDRLLVHQRGCKEKDKINSVTSMENRQLHPSRKMIKPLPGKTVRCSVCGKLYGTKSIKFHEPQCIKKYKQENGFRSKQENLHPNTDTKDENNVQNINPLTKKPNMFPCYLCGRLFSINSIYIHEPHCLKKWRIDNEKLPLDQQRKEPVRPEIKFTDDGKIDFKALEEANWETHLKQLVACKFCKRTFNPDRVEIHQGSCKGPN